MALLEKHLVVKPSNIPGAGKGLFTTIDIKKGERIIEYKGTLHKWKDIKYQDGNNAYLVYLHRNAVINAKNSKAKARYANDANGLTRVPGLRNNGEFLYEGVRCYIEATRKIKAGDEILVDYGKDFWPLQTKIRESKKEELKKAA